ISAATNGVAPRASTPLSAEAERPMFAAACSSSTRLRSAIGRKLEPNLVSVTLRVVRSKSRKPSCSSSSRTSTLIPDCVMKSWSAAREKLWYRAVSRKALSCREVIFIAQRDELMSKPNKYCRSPRVKSYQVNRESCHSDGGEAIGRNYKKPFLPNLVKRGPLSR